MSEEDDRNLLETYAHSWNWAVKKVPRSKMHLAPPGLPNMTLPCIKDMTKCETGSDVADALRIVVALNRTFCNACWGKLSTQARTEIEHWMADPPREIL